jgi:hypothetical protein
VKVDIPCQRLRLAARLIGADSGSITVEGEDVRHVDPILLRRLMDHQASCLLISHDRSFVRTVRIGSG